MSMKSATTSKTDSRHFLMPARVQSFQAQELFVGAAFVRHVSSSMGGSAPSTMQRGSEAGAQPEEQHLAALVAADAPASRRHSGS